MKEESRCRHRRDVEGHAIQLTDRTPATYWQSPAAEPRIVYPPALPPWNAPPGAIPFQMLNNMIYETSVIWGTDEQRFATVQNHRFVQVGFPAGYVSLTSVTWAAAWRHWAAFSPLVDDRVKWFGVTGKVWRTYVVGTPIPSPTAPPVSASVSLIIPQEAGSAGTLPVVTDQAVLPEYVSATMRQTGTAQGILLKGGHRIYIEVETNVDGHFMTVDAQARYTDAIAAYGLATVFEGTDPAPLQYEVNAIFSKTRFLRQIAMDPNTNADPSTYTAQVAAWGLNNYVGSQVSRKFRPRA